MIYKSNNHRLVALLTSLICFSVNVGQALSAEGSEAQPTTTESSTSSAPSSSASALSTTPITFIQPGARNSASVNSSGGSINQSGCNGTCIYAFVRTSPTSNNGLVSNHVEGVIGVMHVLNSPDQMNAETNRQMVDMQRQRNEFEIANNYIKLIKEACQARDFITAELTARGLARIWNEDYKDLLRNHCG
jgi:hypothetical protein